jgi:hypothetical protein
VPGDRNRQRSNARNAAGIALRERGRRGGAGAVEDDGAAGRLVVNMVEPVTAEPGHHRLDHGERRRRRDRRIDRIAALPQGQQSGLSRQRMVCRDAAAAPDDQRPVRTHFSSHFCLLSVPYYRINPPEVSFGKQQTRYEAV